MLGSKGIEISRGWNKNSFCLIVFRLKRGHGCSICLGSIRRFSQWVVLKKVVA